jgi:hypothetical protein
MVHTIRCRNIVIGHDIMCSMYLGVTVTYSNNNMTSDIEAEAKQNVPPVPLY